MCEDLNFLLKVSDLNKVNNVMEIETFYDKIDGKNMQIETIRMVESGSFGVFISKINGIFTEDELYVAERFLKEHKRDIEIMGNDKIGVIFDKECDLRPFNIMDRMFNYTKTYKTQSYARMIGLGVMNGIKEYHMSAPDKIKIYKDIYGNDYSLA